MNKIKNLIVMAFLLLVMVCALVAQNGEAKDPLALMSELNERQNTVFTDANEELLNLGDVVWQRSCGESEYYLAPSANDVELYFSRIRREDDKSRNINKSQFRIVRVALNGLSNQKLREFGIDVPGYYSSDQILVTLPIIDIEALDSCGLILETITDYGKKMVFQPQSRNDSRATIWQEGWEGSMSPYTIGHTSGAASCDWADMYAGTAAAYEGYYVLWCAGGGTQGQDIWSNYLPYMNTYIYKDNSINVSGYSNVQFKYKYLLEAENNYDFLYRYYQPNDGSWTMSYEYTGITPGYPDSWAEWTVNLTGAGWNTYNWKFFFTSDNINNLGGAYLDDLKLSGTIAQQYATLNVTLKNLNGSSYPIPGNDGIVMLYDENYTYLRQVGTNSQGVATFTNVAYGDYKIEGYHDPDPETEFGTEFWGGKPITVNSNTENEGIQRHMPYVYDVQVYNNDTDANITGQTVPLGTNLRVNVKVKNPNSVTNICKLQLYLDRNEDSPFDFNPNPVEGLSVTSGEIRSWNYYYTPTNSGTYHRTAGVWAFIGSPAQYQVTDGWLWDTLVTISDPPSITVTPSSQTVSYAAGSKTFSVAANVSWNVTESCSWVTCNPTSGSNNGTVTVTYTANTGTTDRTCTVTVSGGGASDTYVLTQQGVDPSIVVTPPSQTVDHTAGNVTITVAANVSWTVSDNATWITCSPTSGSNNGTVTVTYTANPGTASRTGTVTVSGSGVSDTFVLTQQGVDPSIVVTPATQTVGSVAGSKTFSVAANVSWNVTESCSWVTCNPTSGSNNGTVTVNYTANPGTAPRTGTVTVSGGGVSDTFVLLQGGGPYLIVHWPSSYLQYESGSATVSVESNVSWTVDDNANWITCTPSSGSGDGTFAIYHTENTSNQPRTCTITVSGGGLSESGTLTQNAAPSIEVTPPTQTVSHEAGTVLVQVTANVSWTVDEDEDWITCIPSSGSGNGPFTVYYTANGSTSDRIGAVTVSGGGKSGNFVLIQHGMVDNDDPGQTPAATELLGNHPNPFNPETTIRYALHESAPVRIVIYDARGHLVKTLVDDTRQAGYHSVVWNGSDEFGATAGSGVYYVHLMCGLSNQVMKISMIK